MDGNSTGDMKDFKPATLNQGVIKASETKSILSYQNGSASDLKAGVSSRMETMADKLIINNQSCQDSFSRDHLNINKECLDLIRKKLISDLSLQVFYTDLENKIIKMEPMEICKERLSLIQKLLVQISQLSDAEKLLLYLKLPSSTNIWADPLRQPLNPLGNRQEIQQTIVWIKTHLEEDKEISIPKQDVYDQYLKYCENVSMKPLSTADFGKVMKQVYPGVRPRRLGTRGNSRYCYSGMRNTLHLPAPSLPQLVQQSDISRVVMKNGSNSVAIEKNKPEKSKRKWKTSTSRNCKFPATSRLSRSSMKDGSLKCSKRSKVDNLIKENEICCDLVEKHETLNSYDLKTEEEIGNSSNSLGSIDNIACELGIDLGINLEGVDGMNVVKSKKCKGKGNGDFFNEDNVRNVVTRLHLKGISNVKDKLKGIKLQNKDILNESNKEKLNGSGSKERMLNKPVTSNDDIRMKKIGNKGEHVISLNSQKLKGFKSNSCTKSHKVYEKNYVPIQPKPMNCSKWKVHLKLGHLQGVEQLSDKNCNVTVCEESDSQEPEEEIARYFKHLDENKLINVLKQPVDSMETAEMRSSSTEDHKQTKIDSELNRCQSCFENQSVESRYAKNMENYCLPQRSQSSVEFSSEPRLTLGQSSSSDEKNNVSHLRMLLEKSVAKCESSQKKEEFVRLSCENEGKTPCFKSLLCSDSSVCSKNPTDSTCVDRRFLAENNINMPDSPSVSSKYFSFTPISPRPRSSLKNSSTPLSSPFISPRNTPVPRSRQNSTQNDHFIPPSKYGKDSCDFVGGISSHANNINGPQKSEISSSSIYDKCSEYSKPSLSARPRSNSSTNFYRGKTRRNLSQLLSSDMVFLKEQNLACQKFVSNAAMNSNFSLPPVSQNLLINDSLTNEIRQLLENQSKIQDIQSATLRSQSVPLNRMIGESSCLPQLAPCLLGQYLNSENPNVSKTELDAEEYDRFVNNNETKSVETFISNEEISSLGLDRMGNDFRRNSEDNYNMVQMSEQLFTNNFDTGNTSTNSNFNDSGTFVRETPFLNKMDLNANSAFSDSFSNSTISDNIKSFLPAFDGSAEREMRESPSKDKCNVNKVKFFNNSYDGGGENAKDPVITSFKPVFSGELSSCQMSPVLGLFGAKVNDDSQLIEFLGLDG